MSNGTYQTFNPGEYFEWEKDAVEERLAIAQRRSPTYKFKPRREPRPLTEEAIIAENRKWNRYDPLYVDPVFAREHGHPSVPCFPGFGIRCGPMGVPGFPQDIADTFCYTNDGSDIRYERTLYAGDTAIPELPEFTLRDETVPGSDLRRWYNGAKYRVFDAEGKLLATISGNTRDCYRKIIDGSQPPSFSQFISEWVDYFPECGPVTEADWEAIRSIWAQEVIAGDDTPYWEDIETGAELPKTCSDGPVTYMHMIYWHSEGDKSIFTREELADPSFMKVYYKDRFGGYLDETALHFGGRNIPGSRSVWYNTTGCSLAARTVTNWMGYKGRVSRFAWTLKPFFKELQTFRAGGEMFDRTPGMEGRGCDRHGAEGDVVVGRAVVIGKYINEKDEGCVELSCWAESLRGEILQACPMEVVLPRRTK